MEKGKFWLRRGSLGKRVATPDRGSAGWCTPPRLLLWFWPLLDRTISWWLGIKPLRPDGEGIICIQFRRHRGQPIRIDEWTVLTRGDLLIELHMNNKWFISNKVNRPDSAVDVRWRVAVAFAHDLRYLAERLVGGRFGAEVNALHGITLLHSPARRLGFTVKQLPDGLRKRLTTFYLSGLRQIYYFDGNEEHIILRRPAILKETWMSKSRLLERYRF